MEKIRPESGFLHFVFANEDDVYYRRQLTAMTFRQYLYYELWQSGYRHMFFLEGENLDSCRIYGANKASCSLLSTRPNTRFFEALITWNQEPESDEFCFCERQIPGAKPLELLKELVRLMKSNSKIAVVMTASMFAGVIRQEKLETALCRINENNARGSLLLVTFPMDADIALNYFAPFQDEIGYSTKNGILNSSLFHNGMKGMIDEQSCSRFFYDLKCQMGERMVFLNTLDYEEILCMTRHHFMNPDYVKVTSEDFLYLEWFAVIIWACCHITAFRYASGITLGEENPYRKMSVIEKSLQNHRTFDQIKQYAMRLRQEEDDDFTPEAYRTQLRLIDVDRHQPYFYVRSNEMYQKQIRKLIQYCCAEEYGIKKELSDSDVRTLMDLEDSLSTYWVKQKWYVDIRFDDVTKETADVLTDAYKKRTLCSLLQDEDLFRTLRKAVECYDKYNQLLACQATDVNRYYLRQEQLCISMLRLTAFTAKIKTSIGLIMDDENELQTLENICIRAKEHLCCAGSYIDTLQQHSNENMILNRSDDLIKKINRFTKNIN